MDPVKDTIFLRDLGRFTMYNRQRRFIHCSLIMLAFIICSWSNVFLYADPVISEFMASNQQSQIDGDGLYSDWIEIYNQDPNAIDLSNWYLTDKSGNLTKWQFPDDVAPLGPLETMIVFASNKDNQDYQDSEGYYHTTFSLDSDGEYLALVKPDGLTIVSEFLPEFPQQFQDVSYGLGIGSDSTFFIDPNTLVDYFVPSDNSLATTWTQVGFNHSWLTTSNNGIGYAIDDPNVQNPGINENIVANWSFSSGETPTLDSSSNNLDATVIGANWSSVGYIGGAYVFDGVDDYLTISNTETMNHESDFSWTAWIKTSGSGSVMALAPTGSWDGQLGGKSLFIDEEGITFDISNVDSVFATVNVIDNEWHHIGLTVEFDNENDIVIMYVDGEEVSRSLINVDTFDDTGMVFNIGYTTFDFPDQSFFEGMIDEVAIWDRALTANDVDGLASGGTISGSPINIKDLGHVNSDIESIMYDVNSSLYLRLPFTVTDLSNIDSLILQMKYDDGFIAYLNGQEVARRGIGLSDTATWNSSAQSDNSILDFEDINITSNISDLSIGNNVLAIHGLNYSEPNDPDFLIDVRLQSNDITLSMVERYFVTPTPDELNGTGQKNLGPLITLVSHTPNEPNDLDNILVRATISSAFDPVDTNNVFLNYRVMYQDEVSVQMFDDGAHNDGAAGDGVFGATIPHSASNDYEMVRYYITAKDTQNIPSRFPPFLTSQTSEYLGTVIGVDSYSTKGLPIFHWFMDDYAEDLDGDEEDEDDGDDPLDQLPVTVSVHQAMFSGISVVGSLYFNGELYDNINSKGVGSLLETGGKPARNFEFHDDHRFKYDPDQRRVGEFRLNTTQADKSYLRQVLSDETYLKAGVKVSKSFPVQINLNGQFLAIYIFTEHVTNRRFLDRHGFNPMGSLFKGGGGNEEEVGDAEKKFPRNGGGVEFSLLDNGVSDQNTLEDRTTFAFDNLDLPAIVNYLAANAIISGSDHVWGPNIYYFYDPDTQLWSLIPWDNDLTFGRHSIPPYITGEDWVLNDEIWADVDYVKRLGASRSPSHPFMGSKDYIQVGGGWRNVIDLIFTVPETREMYVRRLRSLMDDILQPQGIPMAVRDFEKRIDELVLLIQDEVLLDKTVWQDYGQTQTFDQAIDLLKNNYLDPRRNHLYVNHREGSNWKYTSANIPGPQTTSPLLTFDLDDLDLGSEDIFESYLKLVNNHSVSVDISGWKLIGSIKMTFPPGTVIGSSGNTTSQLYLSPDVASFKARTASPKGGEDNYVLGNFEGQLTAWPHEVTLLDDKNNVIDQINFTSSLNSIQKNLRITELMYHPQDPNIGAFNNDDFEFIELQNIGATILDLSGVSFVDGIDFSIPNGTSIDPNGLLLIVKDPNAFNSLYTGLPGNVQIIGSYDGRLSNGGENLTLIDSIGNTILDFKYKDGWRNSTDGNGNSLTVVDPNAPVTHWQIKDQWRPSSVSGGTPGQVDINLDTDGDDDFVDEILIDSLAIKAGKTRESSSDSFTISGTLLDPNDEDLSNAIILSVSFYNLNGATPIFQQELDLGILPYGSDGMQTFSQKSSSGIQSLTIDHNANTFSVQASNVNLTGLASPVILEIQMGDYICEGVAAELSSEYDLAGLDSAQFTDVINSTKRMPLALLQGYSNALQVTKAKFKRNATKADSDSLSVSGLLTTAGDIDLSTVDITIEWGTLSSTIPAQSDGISLKGTSSLKYKKPKGSDIAFSSVQIDLTKGIFKVSAKKVNIGDQENPTNFRISFGTFDQSESVNW